MFFFFENVPSYANQLSDLRQAPDVTGSGAKMASKRRQNGEKRRKWRF